MTDLTSLLLLSKGIKEQHPSKLVRLHTMESLIHQELTGNAPYLSKHFLENSIAIDLVQKTISKRETNLKMTESSLPLPDDCYRPGSSSRVRSLFITSSIILRFYKIKHGEKEINVCFRNLSPKLSRFLTVPYICNKSSSVSARSIHKRILRCYS